MSSTRARTAVLTLLAAAGLLAGCSGADDSMSESGGDSSSSGGSAAKEVAVAGAAPAALSAAAVGPQVVRTAEITVRVDNLRTAAARVRAGAEALGGRVASETTGFGQRVSAVPEAPGGSGSVDDERAERSAAAAGESVLVLRVPEPQLGAALDRVAAAGTELSRASSAQDVSADLADLTSREQTQSASVARVRQLMQRASSLKDVVLLEAELANRETELEAVQARRSTLADRAELATLTAVLRTPDSQPQRADTGLLAGLRDSWQALQTSTAFLLTAAGALIPFAVLAVLLGWPALQLWRRRTRRGAATPASAQPQPQP